MTSISYIIPAYNCSDTIAETIASISDGNLIEGDEIIAVDDGSTDNTFSILNNLARTEPALRVFRHDQNKGGAATRNTAVRHSTKDWIFCLDSDNVLASQSVQRLRNFLAVEGADVACFQELHFFRHDKTIVEMKWRFRPGRVTLADYLSVAVVPGASGNYLYTRQSWERAGGYPEFAGALDAWGFGLRQVATGQHMVSMPDGFYHHRYGHASYWQRDFAKGKMAAAASEILKPFLDQLLPDDSRRIADPSSDGLWFSNLDRYPIRMADGSRGQPGMMMDINGRKIDLRGGRVAAATNIVRRLTGRLARMVKA